MKLYDPKFVHFEWSDKLDGQYCFVAYDIGSLIKSVNENNTSGYGKVSKADEYSTSPFYCKIEGDNSHTYTFAYYDPNYEVKYAYWEMGYDIYYKLKDKNCDWEKVSDNTNFLYVIDDPDYEFKIIDDFTELREAYKRGKTIQHMNLDGEWVDCDVPGFSANHSYRIKPEEIINKGATLDISDKGFGKLDKEDSKLDFCDENFDEISENKTREEIQRQRKLILNEHKCPHCGLSLNTLNVDNCNGIKYHVTCRFSLPVTSEEFSESFKTSDDLYRPFKDTDELIAYWEKHYGNGNRPEYTMPLIWVKYKITGNFYLILGFGKDSYEEESIFVGNRICSMKELFDDYKFLDGKCCGKVKE